MANVLCIDTEPETAQAIADAGHDVERGELGFRTGHPALRHPPHEFDLLVCDLRKPACFDKTFWGPGKNDNYRCKIEKPIEGAGAWYLDRGGILRSKFEIIHPSQMPAAPPGTFGASDIFTAVSKGGIPFVLFLNKEWLRHAGYYSPDFCKVAWTFQRTKATKLSITSMMVASTLDRGAKLALPVEFSITETTFPDDWSALNSSTTIPLVTNSISQVFGEVVAVGKGAIWATPAFEDNAKVCVDLLERFDSFLDIQSSLIALEPWSKHELAQSAENSMSEVDSMRDVFISHASEDKDEVARPLAQALKAKGLSVWFDEAELTLGDRLRRKIEEGLRVSRYGVTILSDSFFRKPWPQAELDALFALERESKKILPVWHGLSASEIAHYTPLLADRLAISTDVGIEKVAEAILRAVTR
jgi:hypothetical protein